MFDGTKQDIQITGIVATTWKTGKTLRNVCNKKALLLLTSIIFLAIGVILLILMALLKTDINLFDVLY